MNSNQQALLRLHLTPGLGRTALFKLKDYFGDFEAAFHAPVVDWRRAGVSARLYAKVPLPDQSAVKNSRRIIEQLGITLLSFWDPDYPPLLREIHDPPALLYLRGQLPQQECFAIVGSRNASPAGLHAARELARGLARHDICIVSGLARGIDSAAHAGALQGEGKTIAVLGCGIDQIYPAENRGLAEQILDSGAIISEHPPGTPPHAGHFPGRNRIISGISKGVLIVEAAEKSGSLITGDFALEQGRELFALPGPISGNRNRGSNRLLKEGAQLVTEEADILQQLWPSQPARASRKKQQDFAAQLNEQAASVFHKLDTTPLHSDEIARMCNLTPMDLSAILLDLVLLEGVEALPGGYYIRTRF